MKVAILGFDTEGRASYDYYAAQGAEITICDQSENITVPAGASSQLGLTYLQNLDCFDVLVRTPGLKPSDILAANPTVAAKITSGTNEFFKHCPTNNVIGITGTKGKGTTSTLVSQMLTAAGQRVHLAGNIGVPAISLLADMQPTDWVVLELSSFQLIDIQHSPAIAACLMVVPEHLNWHTDMNEYLTAKSQLFAHQVAGDAAIYFAGNEFSMQISDRGHGRKVPYYAEPGAFVTENKIVLNGEVVCGTDELKLLGAHNWQNACAAATVANAAGVPLGAVRTVLLSFTGLPHRLEFIREVAGVKYYDDSFGTTPEAAIVAIQAFTEPKIMILGGSDKGVSFDELIQAVIQGNVTGVVTIGQTGPVIAEKLRDAGFANILDGGQSMPEILQRAHLLAAPGSVVLLSTGCASFGMFANYKERGDLFQAAVMALV